MVRRTRGTGETPADQEREINKVEPATALAAGSNSGADATLLSFCERFERLSEEIKTLSEDRTEVMSEAKAHGFDTKTLRQAIRRRAMNKADRDEADAMLDLYETALDRAEKKALQASLDAGGE